MWAAYILAALYTPLCIVKLLLFHYPHNPLPAIFLLITSTGFTVSAPTLTSHPRSWQLH